MTQIQKRRSAYIVASISVLGSFIFWTSVINTMNQVVRLPRAGDIWQGSITGTVSYVLEDILPVVEEIALQHKAAPINVESMKESIQASVLPTVEKEETTVGVSELDQWDIGYAYTLHIPSLRIDTPVLLPSTKYWNQKKWDMLEEQMQVGLSYGSVAYPHSVNMGEKGTMIIAGHSSPPDKRAKESGYGSLFSRLPEVKIGDIIQVENHNGVISTYKIETAEVLPATATYILEQQSAENILKIITCFPIGTTKDRLVVTAKEISYQ